MLPYLQDTLKSSLDLWKMDRIEHRADIKMPLCTSHILSKLAHECGFVQINHPPYSPDLAPSDYYLFWNLKGHLHGTRFPDDKYLKDSTKNGFKSSLKSSIIQELWVSKKKWSKCIEVKGTIGSDPQMTFTASLQSVLYELIATPHIWHNAFLSNVIRCLKRLIALLDTTLI